MNFFQRLSRRFTKRKIPTPSLGIISGAPQELIGRIATTLTPLRSSGFIELDGKKIEVNSAKGFIPENTLVKIVGKQMSWLLVEPV